MKRALLVVMISLSLISSSAWANTPGKHSVSLKWTASTTPGVTYNLYRGSAPGVCNGTPTPYATGITSPSFVDQVGLNDGQTLFYNVSAVGNGESACDGELQVQIPVLPSPPSSLQGTAQ
jgi:hypothetical protein